jgi:hypothetical protein
VSSSITVTQPAYTEAFMSAIAMSATGIDLSKYPSPSGYHVYAVGSTGIVDNTTDVSIYSLSDAYQDDAEVTSVTFVAVFSNLNQYQFNQLAFYTQVGGQDFMEVAEFILSSYVQKPSNYALVVMFTFEISTPTYVFSAIQDVEQECTKYCVNVNCNSVGGNIETSYLPFSPFNLVFLYLLGANINVILNNSNVKQLASQYGNCITSCVSYCGGGLPIECAICLVGCQVYLLENPMFVYLASQNIQSLTQLLPQGISVVYAVDVCRGKVATLTPQNFQYTLNVVSQSEVQYVVQFYLPNANQLFNALEIMLSTPNANYNYSLGVLHFIGVPLPSGENFILEVTVSES